MQEPMSGLTQKVQVTYLAHSGFAVEIGEKVLIFDYYEGDLSFISTKKQVYFFASHAHYDHFREEFFSGRTSVNMSATFCQTIFRQKDRRGRLLRSRQGRNQSLMI